LVDVSLVVVLDTPAFETLAHDLELLRIPLEKHEIPADIKLTELTGTEQSENLIGITNPKL
jgi:hypothetical protein